MISFVLQLDSNEFRTALSLPARIVGDSFTPSEPLSSFHYGTKKINWKYSCLQQLNMNNYRDDICISKSEEITLIIKILDIRL